MTMLFEHLESHGIREEVHDKVSLVVMSDMQVNQACEHGKSQDTL
jgi:hypothetical protein